MIRVNKYPRVLVLTTLFLLFALDKWPFPSSNARNMTYMLFAGLFVVVLLKIGLEGLSERKQIIGKLTNQQITLYRIALGQLTAGIIGVLYFVFYSLFLSSWRIFTCMDHSWFAVTPR